MENHSSNDNSRKSKTTNILLPGEDYVIQSWKVKPGSIVRSGQTVAVAVQQDQTKNHNSSNASSNSSSSSSSSSATAVTAATAAAAAPTTTAVHKRPKKRRRIVVPTTNSNSSEITSHSPTATTTDSTLSRKSITERFTKPKHLEASSSSSPDSTHKPLPSPVSASSSTNTPRDENTATISILATANGLLRFGCPNSDSDNVQDDAMAKLVIGYIEECLHPGVLGGLCIVCGENIKQSSSYDNNDDTTGTAATNLSNHSFNDSSFSSSNNAQDNNSKSQQRQDIRVTVSGGITMTVSETEGLQMAEQASRRLRKLKKLSLVLDLDHTLVHATPDHRARLYATHQNPDVRTLLLPIMEGATPQASLPNSNGGGGNGSTMRLGMQHFVKLRPHINEFFRMVQPLYEVSVYTAGTRQYAEEITIVLSRHMVGATMDLVELEHLRYTVNRATADYQAYEAQRQQQQEEKEQKQVDDANQAEEITKSNSESETAAETTAAKDQEDNDKRITARSKKQSKKSVSFGPPPPDATTDGDTKAQQQEQHPSGCSNDSDGNANNRTIRRAPPITREQLERLQQELAEAERLEKEAWELRQKIFGSRVVSRTDVGDLGQNVKSLKRIFPCGGTMAAVVDDREDVWANASDNTSTTKKGEPPANLLLVKPYHWKPFLEFAEVNNSAKFIDVSDGTNEEEDKEADFQLLWTGQTLQKLHARYYGSDPDGTATATTTKNWRTVPQVLTDMRREVLRGTKIVLSGLVPLHKKNLDPSAPRPPIIRYATALGCELSETVAPGVTHVVAAKDGSDKAIQARKVEGCVLVKASWLVESYVSMSRSEVKRHVMGSKGEAEAMRHRLEQHEQMVKRLQEAQQPLKESDSDSDDDDELAAEFEQELMNL